jgi:hypothetical protein
MKPTPEAVARLPKWARDHIATLKLEADAALRTLRKIDGDQAPTQIWAEYMECLGEKSGPTTTRKYIDARYVYFAANHGARIEVGYDNRGRLMVRTNGPRLLLRCEVSNSVELDTEVQR